ncbi:hypothetical protein [Nocardioides flavescens]|uniref:Uncharacterized protein n=1 Tax=Nocardioides flavescens TaxID=2691959 RepID=A0A6L7F0Z3_9ACTN|nr:hypothetical protein [Nocardioides flavescens]MXG90669.1 hypothetical protein [Nocardioides flavescens]
MSNHLHDLNDRARVTDGPHHLDQTTRPRRRFLPLVWAASAVAAIVLVLGVNGTLSAWTSAIVTNSTNSVATANALILKESNGAADCYSSQGAANSYTCATINKYGGTTTPFSPGDSRTFDVTFSNAGAATGSTFTLTPGTCTQTPTANAAATPPVNNLCTATGELTVAMSCSNGTTYNGAQLWSDLTYAAGPPSALTEKTHTALGAGPGASWTCRFTVALNANASVADQGIVVSQPLVWTLS